MTRKFEWILFDADHTLFDFDRSSKAALEAALEAEGITVQPDYFDIYFKINKQCWRAFENGEIDRLTLRQSRFQKFFSAIGVEHPDPDDFNSNYLNRLPQLPYFMDGAIDLLKSLVGTYALGVVTNGMKEVQRPRLELSGINRFFDIVVVSGEIGVAKPDKAYFDYAHQQMKQPDKRGVLVVGDNLNSDVRGAQNFGYKGCWYNPAGVTNNEGVSPDYQIAALSDVHTLLDG